MGQFSAIFYFKCFSGECIVKNIVHNSLNCLVNCFILVQKFVHQPKASAWFSNSFCSALLLWKVKREGTPIIVLKKIENTVLPNWTVELFCFCRRSIDLFQNQSSQNVSVFDWKHFSTSLHVIVFWWILSVVCKWRFQN